MPRSSTEQRATRRHGLGFQTAASALEMGLSRRERRSAALLPPPPHLTFILGVLRFVVRTRSLPPLSSLSFFFSLMYISVSFISLCASSYLSTFTRRISDLLQSLAGTVSRAQVYSGFHGFLFLPLSRDTLDNRHFFLYHLVLCLATGHCFPFCSVFVLPLRSIAFARCIREKLYT